MRPQGARSKPWPALADGVLPTLPDVVGKKERAKHYAKICRDRKVKWLADLKAAPCLDCSYSYPAECMDFDHVRGKKEFQIGGGVGIFHRSYEEIVKEINKCDVVCSNCHRIRTARRAGRLQ